MNPATMQARAEARRQARGQRKDGCTRDTRRCPAAVNYRQPTPECCKDHIRTITAEIDELFAEHGITWWLDYGQLLGAVRNGGIIPHDKDGDIGVLAEDRDKVLALKSVFKGMGRHFAYRQPHRGAFSSGDRVKIRISERNHTNVDIFFWELSDGTPQTFNYDRTRVTVPEGHYYRHNYVSVDRYKGREFPADKLFPLTELEWEGMALPAPVDPRAFCHHRYGSGWETPIHQNNARRNVGPGWKGPE